MDHLTAFTAVGIGVVLMILWWITAAPCSRTWTPTSAPRSESTPDAGSERVDPDRIIWDRKLAEESVGLWFRTDDGLLVRLILAEPPFGEFVDQRGLVGSLELSRLRRLTRIHIGEWWTFRPCPVHVAKHGFGTLPFILRPGDDDRGPWKDGARPRVACGCAVPDDSMHPQA